VLAVPAAQAATTTCSGTGTIPAGDYMIQANEWNSSAPQCITYTSGTAWSVSTANFNLSGGAPATYPSIFKGCHWGLCTGNSGMPIQMSRLGSATSSWSTAQPSSGAYDVAYDIWFNSTPTTSGQPDGTEVMVWINSRGGVQPFGSQTGTTNAAGMTWNVWTGRQTSWNIISYVLNPGATSVSNLDLKALFNDAVARGSINPAHYLIDVEAGFEIWQGGQGLGTNSFSVTATAGGGSTGGTTGALHAVGAGKCLDDPNSTTTLGTQQQIYTCNGQANQTWTKTSSGTLTLSVGGQTLCLDANNQGTTNGTKAIIWSCNGQVNQQWNLNSNGTITGVQSGLCLDVTGAGTANGTLVELWACNGGSNQQWTLG
jgi:Glycosyl hydrolase family 12/Ricin-type beta-trefoil lectin domain